MKQVLNQDMESAVSGKANEECSVSNVIGSDGCREKEKKNKGSEWSREQKEKKGVELNWEKRRKEGERKTAKNGA